ncbi:MAG: toprim domain-containing protein [Sulfurimonas sp.]|jgi:twinkle protein
MQIIEKENRKEYNISLTKYTGEELILCPVCSAERKKKTIKCFSWNHEKQVGRCNHCGLSFYMKREYIKPKEYVKPEDLKSSIDEKTLSWFNDKRGITKETLEKMYIQTSFEYMPQEQKEMNCINFKYYKESELINIKYRDAKKNFKLFKDAELIFYNYNALIYNDTDEIIITEGEIDCLTFIECGMNNVISVPNGANKGNCNMSYLDSCINLFDKIKKVYLCTDNDEAGINLRNEFVRRLGIDKCFYIDLKETKDINEFYLKHNKNKEIVKKVLEIAEEFIIEGVVKVINYENELDDLYLNGIQKGKITKHRMLDEAITWQTGRVAIVTGIPSHGKSEAIDDFIERLNILHGWKVGYFSPENYPLQLHGAKIIEKLTGKKFNRECLSIEEMREAKIYMNDNFFFIKSPDENYTIENIIEKQKFLINRFGIKIAIIDPFNRLEHQIEKGVSETNYISKLLDKITMFSETYNILTIVVAHPRKMNKKDKLNIYEVPNLYDINGSANFYNKCSYGLTVYRDFLKEIIEVHVQKVKFKHLGKPALCLFKYNINNGRFTEIQEENSEPDWDNENHIRNGIF